MKSNETIRARTLNLKVEGPYIIHYRRKRHHGWRRRAKKILKNMPSRMAKNLLFLCALPKTLSIDETSDMVEGQRIYL